jgi:hypothetical protein
MVVFCIRIINARPHYTCTRSICFQTLRCTNHRYAGFAPFINDLAPGTLSAAHFVAGLGGRAKKIIWDLDVFLYNATEACDQIRYIASLPGQQDPGVLVELGNELYSAQGLPRFANSTAYAEAMIPIAQCARELMPNAKIGAVGTPGEWNKGLVPYLHLFDGVSHHNYSPRRADVDALSPSDRITFVAGYSRAAARADVSQQHADLGVRVPMWLTEFGYGLDPDDACMLPDLMFGALHGVFHASRIMAAINDPGAFEALCFER